MSHLYVLRARTAPAARPTRRRPPVQRIGTTNNDWQALQALVTAWFDCKEL